MLSKACIVGIYQRKLEEMAKLPNIELQVVVPPTWRDERGVISLERAYVHGYELSVTPIYFNGNFHFHYYPDFAKYVREFQPDIIHIDEEPYNLATWLALRTSRLSRAKVLFFSWQNLYRRYPFPFSWFEQTVIRQVDYALMGTESAAQIWRQKGYQGRLAIIPQFGVDATLFVPPIERGGDGVVHIGYVGRLVAEKGADLLLEALATLKSEGWDLQIIGSGPERANLDEQVERLQIVERVKFVEWLPSTEMPHTFQKLDVVVVPSRTRSNWKEQFGRVLIEAMASEAVVIGSDSGAIPDVVGDAGLIFVEDNIADLADCLCKVITDADLRIQLGQKGRQRVLENFTQTQIAQQTVQVYQEMLTASGSSAQNDSGDYFPIASGIPR